MRPSSQSVEVTHSATFTATVIGVGSNNFTYQWKHNGSFINETTNVLIISDVAQHNTGMYNCTVMNQYGDSDSSLASLIVKGIYNGRHFTGFSCMTSCM